MRKLSLFLCLIFLSSCSYFQDRSSDFGDMVNLGVEGGSINASVQLSNQVLGFGGPSTRTVGYGAMNGYWGEYYVAESKFLTIANSDDPSDPTILPFFHRENPNEESLSLNPEFRDSWVKYFHVEVNATTTIGARVGVNVAEILDFALGLIFIDIANDDSASEEWSP